MKIVLDKPLQQGGGNLAVAEVQLVPRRAALTVPANGQITVTVPKTAAPGEYDMSVTYNTKQGRITLARGPR